MRVAVSDYDGTLFIDGEVEASTVSAIDRWREYGNKFVIATGRALDWILPEISKWRIKYDALICVNGAAVFDADFSLIQRTTIPKGLVDKLLHHRASAASREIHIIAKGEVYIPRTRSGRRPMEGLPFQSITLRQACELDQVEQISYEYSDATESSYWLELMNQDMREQVSARRNIANIDVNNLGVDKGAAIAMLLAHTGWPDKDILVIGDGNNDEGMISRYGGSTLESAGNTIRMVSCDVFNGVGDMLENAMPDAAVGVKHG